ncbi:hypothetical protein K492DRAFT_240235 [Lichtheimia hyalospora FSU 10163]|nr:hypothetical protein K492DRAFT_240235 [Lichtheimia hyalospora FSU 10163]
MQAPDDPPFSSSSHFHLPSPDSDQDPLVTESQHTKSDMVTLPSSPSCIFSPNTATTTTTTPSAQQLPTPRTPSNDDDDTTTISSTMANNNQLTPMIVPAKRGYKSHVPSACVNCRKAHLACDVSRPCKRCVAAGKSDTCHDAKHKKRGRPRLHETKRFSGMYGGSVILDTSSVTSRNKARDMIQTATFTMTTAMHRSTTPSTTPISFVHEPIESFQDKTTQSPQHVTMSHRKKESIGSSQSQQALREPEPPPSSISNHDDQSTITMFLSMDMCCARTSDEVTELWGYHPQDLVHRSLYGLISSHDNDRLGRLHRLLLDNIMDMAKRHDTTLGSESRPPPSERATSPIFYDTDPDRLMMVAPGSGTFSDTLHFKKHDGEHELYEVIVYLGGGLGADLTKPSTLKHLYVVAEMKKHQYRIEQRLLTHHHHTPFNASSLRFKQTLPRVHASTPQHTFYTGNTSSSSSSLSMGHTTLRPIAPQLARSSPSGPLQARQGSLPGHFAANSQLNTVSLPASKKDAPKINIAPISNHERHSNHGSNSNKQQIVTERLFPSFTGGPYFRRIAAASPNGSAPPPIGRESNNPYSTLAYRFAPAAPPAGSPRGGPPSYTHPTTQYFLQTSSSTLNAAASAAQSSSNNISTATIASHGNSTVGDNTMAADNDKAVGKTDSKRKAEMSIRSLLC